MERDSFNENLERFLRYNADNLRMPASEKVWKNISKEMSRRRRLIGFTLSAIFLLTAVGGYFLVNNSVKPLPHPATTQQVQKQVPRVSEIQPTASIIGESLKTPSSTTNKLNNNSKSSVPGDQHKNNDRKNSVAINLPNSNNTAPGLNTPANETALVNQGNSLPSFVVDSYDDGSEKSEAIQFTGLKKSTADQYPLSIESVVNSYKAKAKKFTLEVSFSPTVSYRKLSENKSYNASTSSVPAGVSSLYSVNDAVTQKPAMGLELSVLGKYPVSKNVKLIGGLQFNVSRYDIKAYTGAPTLATFRLNTSSGVDYVNAYTPFSNTGGYQSDWLQNLYLQLSVPMGVEVKLAGDNNTQFGIASTIQPTYVFGDKAYLITSDYQSYAQVPGLTRHWNINTNLQTFVSYSTGKMRWQVGPQVRYQLLSSYVSKYPVKENLFDFGLRVGISLNKQ